MNIPTFIPAPQRRHHKRKTFATTKALTLIAATYQDGATVTLEFDREIDVSAYSGVGVLVDDADNTGEVFQASGTATLLSANVVRVGLVDLYPSEGSGITLVAPATNGIVAVDDGAAWAGTAAIELPFG